MFRSLGADIWDHEIPIRFGGIPLWHRMTVIRLASDGLLVHSPTRLNLAVSRARPDCCDCGAKLVARSLFARVSERLSRRAVLWGAEPPKMESVAAFRRSSRRLGAFTLERRDRSSSRSRDRSLSGRDRILSSAQPIAYCRRLIIQSERQRCVDHQDNGFAGYRSLSRLQIRPSLSADRYRSPTHAHGGGADT